LVVDYAIGDGHIVASAHIESIRVMGRWKTTTYSVWCISCGVVHEKISEYRIGATGDAEQMSRPILDMEVLDH